MGRDVSVVFYSINASHYHILLCGCPLVFSFLSSVSFLCRAIKKSSWICIYSNTNPEGYTFHIFSLRKNIYSLQETHALVYDPSSDYDYRYDNAFLELLEAILQSSLNQIDMVSILEILDDD